MNKIMLLTIVLSCFLNADLIEDGLDALNKGNIKKSIKLYSKACDDGNTKGCNYAGMMYHYGITIKGGTLKQDTRKALKFFTKACDGGNTRGCVLLGIMYYEGTGVRQDKRKAKELFGKACDDGEDKGCRAYRKLNEEGI